MTGGAPTRPGLPGLAAAMAAALALAACSGEGGGGLGLFDHARRFVVAGSHQGFGCERCHDPSALSFTLGGAGGPPGVDCLGCHPQSTVDPGHAGVPGYAYAMTGCISCHRDGTAAISPADHAALFPIASGDLHGGIACVDCHGPSGKSVADLQCAACHAHPAAAMDAWHAPPSPTAGYEPVAGYANDGPACYRCHGQSSIPSFAHRFAIGAGATHGPPMACRDCHAPAAPTPDQLQCTACHAHSDPAATAARHAGVTGFAYDSASCAGCHAEGGSPLPAGHDTDDFPVTGTRHAGVGCSQCHGADRTPAQVTCVPCHAQGATDASHLQTHGIPGTTVGRRDGATYTNYEYASAYCLRCHADGQVNAISTHPTFSGRRLNDGEHGPFCLTCHQARRIAGKTWSADFATFTCLACHTDNSGGGGD